MEIEYTSHFKRIYQKLPLAVQKKAEKQETVFRNNPLDQRLDTHKLHGKLKAFYSFSVDRRYRIVFQFLTKERAVFLDVGDHDVYR